MSIFSGIPEIIHREEFKEVHSKCLGIIQEGFIAAAEAANISHVSVEISGTRVKVNLPPARFFKRTFKGNYCMVSVHLSPNNVSVSLYGGRAHPHVSDNGNFCWTGGIDTAALIREGKFEWALIGLINTINSYTPQGAYNIPDNSIPCCVPGCNEQGVEVSPYYTDSRAPSSDHYVCNLHARVCAIEGCAEPVFTESLDGYPVCTKHIAFECPQCGEQTSMSNMFKTQMTRRKHTVIGCKKCGFICRVCGVFKSVEEGEIGGAFTCEKCTISRFISNVVSQRYRIYSEEIISWQTNTNPLFIV